MNRREMILGAAGAIAGVSCGKLGSAHVPTHVKRGDDFVSTEPAPGEVVLWATLLGGQAASEEEFHETVEVSRRAVDAGFEVMSTVHVADKLSKILVCKVVRLAEARRQERLVFEDYDSSIFSGITRGVEALWVERGFRVVRVTHAAYV